LLAPLPNSFFRGSQRSLAFVLLIPLLSADLGAGNIAMNRIGRGWLIVAVAAVLSVGCATPKVFWTPKQWEQEIAFHPVKYPTGDWRPTNIVYQDVWL